MKTLVRATLFSIAFSLMAAAPANAGREHEPRNRQQSSKAQLTDADSRRYAKWRANFWRNLSSKSRPIIYADRGLPEHRLKRNPTSEWDPAFLAYR